MPHKLTLNIPDGPMADLRQMSEARGVTMSRVLADAISLEAFVRDAKASGQQLLVRNAEGEYREVVIR